MARKMLIDAAHPEETRVVVVSGNRVEEFDFETLTKKQLKGNIYLAKVTRVEPSLQAAFVEYGGNRHGFLAFSEIHPDYYQIPHEDRLALLREQAEEEDEDEEEDIEEALAASGASDTDQGEASEPVLDHDYAHGEEPEDHPPADELSAEAERAAEPAPQPESQASSSGEQTPLSFDDHVAPTESFDQPASSGAQDAATEASGLAPIEISTPTENAEALSEEFDEVSSETGNEIETLETSTAADAAPEEIGAQDAMEELPRRKRKPVRRYKIQEVIKRRQILLVQVVKEERGNKGAALTTFLSLAGRYCVLMPNTDRGGGISRKITSGADRKRLKEIAHDLEVPEGMGLIVRTAGANKTKAELKRDFEYLLRLWESVRELTLQSTAPALVYEEGNLVKRSIRDLYGRDIDEVLVEGDEAYKEAKAFMKMLTPSHAKNVQTYTDKLPLFQRYQVETQLDSLFSPRVELRSGGYIVINSTEALVAIDVNSGKATREHSIEETALKTNLEAAEEVARQLRLRDLAGLIVIDFIDMEEYRHDRAVERKLKDCLKTDRARIQVGRISAFGLLEMSRQRLRASVLEGSTLICDHCEGAGRVPSTETTALRILRAIEEEGVRGRMDGAHVKAPPEVALYLLNYKRPMLQQIEERFALPCYIESTPEMKAGHFVVERAAEGLIDWQPAKPVISPESGFAASAPETEEEIATQEDEAIESESEAVDASADAREESRFRDEGRGDGDGRRGRRRRRRGGRRNHGDREYHGEQHVERETEAHHVGTTESGMPALEESDESGGETGAEFAGESHPESQGEEHDRRRRRRGRRGGRRNRRRDREDQDQRFDTGAESAAAPFEPSSHFERTQDDQPAGGEQAEPITYEPRTEIETEREPAPARHERIEIREISSSETRADDAHSQHATQEPANGHHGEQRVDEDETTSQSVVSEPEIEDPNRPRRKGWWQRKIFG